MRERLLREGPRARRAILLGVVVLVPLLALRNLHDPINTPKLGVLIIGVSLVFGIRMAEGLQTRDFQGLGLLWVPATAVSAALTVGWLFSPYKGWALWGVYPRLLGLLPYLFVVALGILLADTFRGDASPIAWAMAAVGALCALYAVVQFLGLDPLSWSVKGTEAAENLVVSTLGNPNFAGAFFAIALPVAMGLLLLHPARRALIGVLAGLIFLGWVVAASQAAWAAGVAGLAVLAGNVLASRWRPARLVGLLVAVAMSAVVVGAVLLSAADVAESRIPATVQRRAEWWIAATSMAADSPFVGRGPNVFALEHAQHRTQEDVRQVGLDITDDPHSLFLSFLTSAGLFGVVGFLLAVGWVVREVLRTEFEDKPLAAAFLAALVAYFVQSLVSIDTVALRSAGWVVLGGFVGSVAPVAARHASAVGKKKKPRREPLRATPLVGLAAVVALSGVWLGGRLVWSDSRFRQAGDLLDEGKGQPAVEAYEDAISFSGNVYYRRVYGNVLGDVAVGIGREGAPFMEQSREAFAFVHDLPQVNATLDYAATLGAWAGVDRSSATEAVEMYRLATTYDPKDGAAFAEAAAGLMELQLYEEVVELLDPVVGDLDRADLWGHLALAHVRYGDEEAAQAAIETALGLDPAEVSALQAQELLTAPPPSP